MAKRRLAVIAVLVCLCFGLIPQCVMASSTTEASTPIDLSRECSLQLSYTCDGTAFENISVKLYKIADVSTDFQYTFTSSFESSGLQLNGIQTNSEWNVIRATLETYIVADKIKADNDAVTDADGRVCFDLLTPGLYLASVGTATQNELTCYFDSALVSLPGLSEEGVWEYQLAVSSKSELVPPSVNNLEFKVIKLWKGDEGKNVRPQSVEVEIFRDSISYETVTLSKDNNWSYIWTAKDDGSKWTVIERNTPSEYTMTVEKRDNSFVLTNTYTPEYPSEPSDPPPTGDTTNIMLYVVLMIGSGSLLIILGIIEKRSLNEENK